MPEPLTIASTAVAGTRLGISLYKEIKKVCKWLTRNLDSVGRFSLAGELLPGELIAKYHEFYIDNTQNQQALSEALTRLSILEQKAKWCLFKRKTKSQPIVEKLLFQGAPKIGKTRAVYEKVIKRFPDFLVFMPSPAELDKVKSSELHPMPGKRGLILFLDDLDQFVVRQDIDLKYLIYRLQRACPRLLVVATSRTGVEMTDKVMAQRHGRDLLLDFLKIDFGAISKEQAGQLAQNIGKVQYEFDGQTPGSVVLGLDEMRHRLESLGQNEQSICKALKLLLFALAFEPEKDLVKSVSDAVFDTYFQARRMEWDNCIERLVNNNLLKKSGNCLKPPHRDYYDLVYSPNYTPEEGDLDSLMELFADKKNSQLLLYLGFSMDMLWKEHDKAQTCYDRALEIDPKCTMAFFNKGTCLAWQCRYEEAIKCYDKALEIKARFWPALYAKGFWLHKTGRIQEGEECIKRAEEIRRVHLSEGNIVVADL